jgi:AcrR family transcriptional regulator
MSIDRRPTAERRRQIAEAALRILSKHGVRKLTAVALAADVGISDGTIFRHFKNKQEIVEAAIDKFEAAFEGTYPESGGDPLENLGTFVVRRLKLMRKNPELLRLAFNDRLAEAGGEAGAARVARMVRRSVEFVEDCLGEAQARGLVSEEVPVTLLVWMVIGVVRGAAEQVSAGARKTRPLVGKSPQQIWKVTERFLRSTGGGSIE